MKKTYFQVYSELLFIFISGISSIVLCMEGINKSLKITNNDWSIIIVYFCLPMVLLLLILSASLMLFHSIKFTLKNIIQNLIIFPILTPIDILGILIGLDNKYAKYVIAILIIGFVFTLILTIKGCLKKEKKIEQENKSIENEVDKNE